MSEQTKHAPMVVAAARELCKRASEACNVDVDDSWKVYGSEFLADAQAALDAAAVPELLEALLAILAKHDDRDGQSDLWPKEAKAARAAIANATGSAP